MSAKSAQEISTATRLHLGGFFDEAEKLYLKAIKRDPANVDVRKLLAKLYMQTQNWIGAESNLRSVLAVRPTESESLSLYGVALTNLGRTMEAVAHISKSVKGNMVRDDEVRSRIVLYQIQLALGNKSSIFGLIENVERLWELGAANDIQMMSNLIGSYELIGELDKARDAIARIQAKFPQFSDEWLLRESMLSPPIMESEQQIDALRAKLEATIDHLLTNRKNLGDGALRQQTFFLTFHGRNNRALLSKLGQLFSSIPWVRKDAAHVATPRDGLRPIRVGFYSSYFREGHSISRTFSRLIYAMSELDDFEVFVIAAQHKMFPVGVNVSERGILVQIDPSLPFTRMRDEVSALALDVLLYCDIGMDVTSYFLACSRLARLQCVLGGHPDTTGIPTMDCFISDSSMEPENAADHYAERLVALSHGICTYERPTWSAEDARWSSLGFTSDQRVYFCPMMLQKIHPDMDAVVGKLLDADPNAVVAFPEDGLYGGRWAQLLKKRIDGALGSKKAARVKFIPWQHTTGNFVALLRNADALIDPVGFGAGTTALIAIAAGVPFVTLPGEFLRERVVAGFYEKIGVTDTVATDVQDYISKAVRLANDPDWRLSIGNKMCVQGESLFSPLDRSAVTEFAEVIRQLVEDRSVTA